MLKKIYYDPKHPAGFGGVEKLYMATKKKWSRENIKQWLQKQETYTLHRKVQKRFRKRKVIVGDIDEQWQADLVDLSALKQDNDNTTFLLTCIDVLSKFAWCVPLKDKKGSSLVDAFQTILASGRKCHKLQTDAGMEFLNRQFQNLLRKHDIKFFMTNNETKCSLIERFNRTLKSRMWKYFTANQTRRYLDVLSTLVNGYNHAYHRSIKRAPASVTQKNASQVWETLYGKDCSKGYPKFIFKVGDKVRISKAKRTFEKGYTPNWTRELFVVSERIATHPPVYRLQDLQGEFLDGTFYEKEMQKVTSPDSFLVEKVLKEKGKGKNKQYLVRWLGYPPKFDSWVGDKDIARVYK